MPVNCLKLEILQLYARLWTIFPILELLEQNCVLNKDLFKSIITDSRLCSCRKIKVSHTKYSVLVYLHIVDIHVCYLGGGVFFRVGLFHLSCRKWKTIFPYTVLYDIWSVVGLELFRNSCLEQAKCTLLFELWRQPL